MSVGRRRSGLGRAMDAVGADLVTTGTLTHAGWIEWLSVFPAGPSQRIAWEPLSLTYEPEAHVGGGDEQGLVLSGVAFRVGCHIWAEDTDRTLRLLEHLVRGCWRALGAAWRLISGEWVSAGLEQDRAAYGRALLVQLEVLVPMTESDGASMAEVETVEQCSEIDVPGGSGPESGCCDTP